MLTEHPAFPEETSWFSFMQDWWCKPNVFLWELIAHGEVCGDTVAIFLSRQLKVLTTFGLTLKSDRKSPLKSGSCYTCNRKRNSSERDVIKSHVGVIFSQLNSFLSAKCILEFKNWNVKSTLHFTLNTAFLFRDKALKEKLTLCLLICAWTMSVGSESTNIAKCLLVVLRCISKSEYKCRTETYLAHPLCKTEVIVWHWQEEKISYNICDIRFLIIFHPSFY